MKTYKTVFKNKIPKMELSDFSVGNRMKYDGNGISPRYLAEYIDLYVKKINKKTICVISKSFPNEHWNIPSVYLKKLDENLRK